MTFRTFSVANTELLTVTAENTLAHGALIVALERLNKTRFPGSGSFGSKCSIIAVEARRAVRAIEEAITHTGERHAKRDADGGIEPAKRTVRGENGEEREEVVAGMIQIADPMAYNADITALLTGASEIRAQGITPAEFDAVDCEAELKESLLPFVAFPDELVNPC